MENQPEQIPFLIKNGIDKGHRVMFFVIGENAPDQIPFFYKNLQKLSGEKPNVLWCSKQGLNFNNNKRRNSRSKEPKIAKTEETRNGVLKSFLASVKVHYCNYKDTRTILGKTFGMCILQDFEALTPNVLARTIETVKGGGVILFILPNLTSLDQLYNMHMDVHQKFRTEAHHTVHGRFNKRFVLSLSSCCNCLVIRDDLQILPIIGNNISIHEDDPEKDLSKEQHKFISMKLDTLLHDPQLAEKLIKCCRTNDQKYALVKFVQAMEEKSMKATVSLTAARGRGKSATLGLAIAGAIALGFSNIYVSSPSPENLNTLFEFAIKGLRVLDYQEYSHYRSIQSLSPEHNKAVVQIDIFKSHKQIIQYLHPTDSKKIYRADLLVIDEAAAIPLSYIVPMLGPYLIFLSSTVNGYEGTGRSLSLKLIQQMRNYTAKNSGTGGKICGKSNLNRRLEEMTLDESIRYKPGDKVEEWLNDLLCLNAMYTPIQSSKNPLPNDCKLYYINRDALFSYSNKKTEVFLQRLMTLYVSSHYKNSPNDLQMMSDAPAHHLFCLMAPFQAEEEGCAEILVVIQVCLEGQLSINTVNDNLGRGRRPAGDLIPWLMVQLHPGTHFPILSGARIIRIATHPDYQSKGYASYALNLLKRYYKKELHSSTEENSTAENTETANLLTEENKTVDAPLLQELSKKKPESVNYIGVSFGLTMQLLKFWKRNGFVMTYIRSTANEITGEHSCIMLSNIDKECNDWMETFWMEFIREFVAGQSGSFRSYPSSLALSLLTNDKVIFPSSTLNKNDLSRYFTSGAMKRLDMYGANLTDYQFVQNLIPDLAKLYFLRMLGSVKFSVAESVILLALGLQRKTVEKLVEELDITSTQLFTLLSRVIHKAVQHFKHIIDN